MGARGWILTAVTIAVIGGGGALLYFNSKDDTTTVPEVGTTTTAPAASLTKDRLDEIAATINKQEPTAEKLKSQASVIDPSLRENFLKLGRPIGNIAFASDIKSEGPVAEVSSTGADGIQYRVVLVYVNDPAKDNQPQWLVLYTEAK
jgi:hypothetical protein